LARPPEFKQAVLLLFVTTLTDEFISFVKV
jgi:hypothetical protein